MKKYYFHFIFAVLVIFTVGCEKEILEELTTVDQGQATQLPHRSEQLQMVPYGTFTAPVKELALRLKVKGIPKKGTKTTAGDSIITDYARIFYNENDQTTSYTFLKHKEDTAHGDLENLVVVTAGDSIQKAYTIHYSAGSVTNGFPYVPSIDDTSITAWPYDIELLENIFNRDCSLDVVTVFIYVFCMNGGDTNSCGSPGEHTGGTYVTSTVSTCDAIQDATGGGGSSGGGFLSGGGSNYGGGIVGGSSPVLPDHVKFEIFKGNLPRGAQEYLDSELVLNTEIYHLMQLHRFSIEIQSRVEPILSQLGDLGSDLPYAGMGGLLEATEESVLKVLGFVTAMPLLSLEEAVVLSNIEMLTGEILNEEQLSWILDSDINFGLAEDFIGIIIEIPEARLDRYRDLLELVEEDPFAFLDIDCNQIENWQELAQHTAPDEVQTKVDNLPGGFINDFYIQSLENATGVYVNMDFFGVNMTTLPTNPDTGQTFTPDDLLDSLRRDLNSFVEGSTFEPYCEISSMCENETTLWNSTNPLGAIQYIDIFGDDGVVIVSEYSTNYWFFSTLNAPWAGNHPVSGVRQFGYEINNDNSYTFFVRGVDRIDSINTESLLLLAGGGNQFFGADNLWESFQLKLSTFVNESGDATILEPIKNRERFVEVKEVLRGDRPISDLGCN